MTLTDQTKRDLASILDTLDQRIHEVTSGCDQETPIPAEAEALRELRDRTTGMLRAD